MPLNDVMGPILQAYFEGKKLRENREDKLKQIEIEQNRLQQQNEQFKAEQVHKQNILDQADRFHKDTMALQDKHAQIAQKAQDFGNAINKARLVTGLQEFRQKFGGAPMETTQLPMQAFDPGTVGMEKAVKFERPWSSIPGLEDLQVDVSGTTRRGTEGDAKAEAIRQRAEDQDENRRAQLEREKLRLVEEAKWRHETNVTRQMLAQGLKPSQEQMKSYYETMADDVQRGNVAWDKVPQKWQPEVRARMDFLPKPKLQETLSRFSTVGPLLDATREIIPELSDSFVGSAIGEAESKIPYTALKAKADRIASLAGNLLRLPSIGSAEKGNAALKEVERVLKALPNMSMNKSSAIKTQGELESAIVKLVEYELKGVPEGKYKEAYREKALGPLGLYKVREDAPEDPHAAAKRAHPGFDVEN